VQKCLRSPLITTSSHVHEGRLTHVNYHDSQQSYAKVIVYTTNQLSPLQTAIINHSNTLMMLYSAYGVGTRDRHSCCKEITKPRSGLTIHQNDYVKSLTPPPKDQRADPTNPVTLYPNAKLLPTKGQKNHHHAVMAIHHLQMVINNTIISKTRSIIQSHDYRQSNVTSMVTVSMKQKEQIHARKYRCPSPSRILKQHTSTHTNK